MVIVFSFNHLSLFYAQPHDKAPLIGSLGIWFLILGIHWTGPAGPFLVLGVSFPIKNPDFHELDRKPVALTVLAVV